MNENDSPWRKGQTLGWHGGKLETQIAGKKKLSDRSEPLKETSGSFFIPAIRVSNFF